MKKVILVNNTRSDIRDFDTVFIECVRNNKPLPEELADLFTLEVVEIDGERRGTIRAA
jgi:hypothetical protein